MHSNSSLHHCYRYYLLINCRKIVGDCFWKKMNISVKPKLKSLDESWSWNSIHPKNIYLLEVNHRITRKRCVVQGTRTISFTKYLQFSDTFRGYRILFGCFYCQIWNYFKTFCSGSRKPSFLSRLILNCCTFSRRVKAHWQL